MRIAHESRSDKKSVEIGEAKAFDFRIRKEKRKEASLVSQRRHGSVACGALKPGGRVGATGATGELAGTNCEWRGGSKKTPEETQNRMTRHGIKEGELV